MKIDTKSWGNKPIEEFSRWEQREIYSYQDINERNTKLELVNKIMQAVDESSDLNWTQDDLDLLSESLIQKKLRDNNNLEIKCWKLDDFPTSIAELKSLLANSATTTTAEPKTKLQFRNIIDSIWVPMMIIFSVIGLIYYEFDLIGWGFLASYIIGNTVTLIMHEKWVHNILVPKNRYVGYLLDFYAYFMGISTTHSFTSQQKKIWTHHLYHHRFNNTKKDYVKDELSNGRIRYYFNWFLKRDQNLIEKQIKMVQNDYQEMYDKLDNVEKFLEDHSFKLVSITHIILFLMLGIHYYFYFVFLPCAYFRIFITQLVESLCYDNDNFWLFPLVLGHAYHASHHDNSNKLILGPAISKYLNIQFYFVKLFYHVRTEILWVNQFNLPIHDRLIKLLPYKNLILTIVSVFGLFYYKFDLLGWAVLEAWVISNLLFLNIHEKWGHGYIIGKNKILNGILDIISYLFIIKLPLIENFSLEAGYKSHYLHHKYWQTNDDRVDGRLKNSNAFSFIFGDTKDVDFKNQDVTLPKTNYYNSNSEIKFIDQHQKIIMLLLHVGFLTILGIKYYFYFVLLQIWFYNIYDRTFIEYVPHKLLKNKQDIPILIPFVGTSAALHNEHHIRNTHILDDSGLLRKYLNPHYYLTKLFFKLA